jgi:Domain of unknown function (DUF3578).
MNQGATAHQDYYAEHRPSGVGIDKAALAEVTAETKAIRAQLAPELLQGTLSDIDLGASKLYLPRGYEAGNIAAVSYDLGDLPAESQLRGDLQRFLVLYQESVIARSAAIASNPDKFNIPAPLPPATGNPGSDFRPKDSSDYYAWIAAHQQKKSRKHEGLINSFVEHAKARGWTAATKGVHPRDLVLRKTGNTYWSKPRRFAPTPNTPSAKPLASF